jgi:hypothetical protein
METLIDASKEVGLEVNTGKTKYMLLSRHQNAGQSHDIKIANKCFENVEGSCEHGDEPSGSLKLLGIF